MIVSRRDKIAAGLWTMFWMTVLVCIGVGMLLYVTDVVLPSMGYK